MKKPFKVLLVVLSVLLILCSIVAVWQIDNIKAVIDAFRYTEQELSDLMTDNEKIISEALSKYPEVSVRDIEEEEIKAFEEGEITQDDLVDIALGKTSLSEVREKKEGQAKSENTEKENPDKADKPASAPANTGSSGDEEVAALVAKMYVLKSTYVGKLDALVAEAIAEYQALPKEKRGIAAKQKIMSAKLGTATSLEAQCDAQVEAVLTDLTAVLKKQGRDLTLINSIRTAYANEKQLKKSYYINKYLN